LDEVVLTARSRNVVPNTLRFLQSSPRCTLVGYHQAVEQEIRIPYCHEHGIEINRRLTGGGGLFWDESQLGWEIFAEIASVKERVTCLAWELSAVPPLAQIKAALAAGFAEVLGVRFEPGPLTTFEEELLAQRLAYFQSDEWVYGVRRPLAQRSELRALFKSPGGLIRASLVVDASARRIREVFITGDFFAYPRRAILDLEARLKGAPADVEAVRRIVEEFFATEEIQIPGVTAADMVRTLREALEKITYVQYGIPPTKSTASFRSSSRCRRSRAARCCSSPTAPNCPSASIATRTAVPNAALATSAMPTAWLRSTA